MSGELTQRDGFYQNAVELYPEDFAQYNSGSGNTSQSIDYSQGAGKAAIPDAAFGDSGAPEDSTIPASTEAEDSSEVVITAKRPTQSPDYKADFDSSAFHNPWGSLPEYSIYIQQPDRNIYMMLPMGEDTFAGPNGNAEYEAPLRGLLDAGGGSNVHTAIAAMGYRLHTRLLSAKVWQGSTFGESMQVQIELVAETDPFKDVLEPYLNLAAMVVADTSNSLGIYKSPGPYLGLIDSQAHFLEDAYESLASSAKKFSFLNSYKGLKDAAGNTINQSTSALSNIAASAYDSFGSYAHAGITAVTSGSALESLEAPVEKVATALDTFMNTTAKPAVQKLTSKIGDSYGNNNPSGYLESLMKNKISIRLGRFLQFDNCVITQVTPNWTWMPIGTDYGKSDGYLAKCTVTLEFRPFFELTLADFKRIFVAGDGRRVEAWYNSLTSKMCARPNLTTSGGAFSSKIPVSTTRILDFFN